MSTSPAEDLAKCLAQWRADVAKLGLSKNDAQVAESIGRTVERLIVAVKAEDVKEKALQAQTYSWQITDAYFVQPPSGRALSKAVERIARERR